MAASERGRIGVLGAGAMGSGIAQVAAAAGHAVVVVDAHAPSIERARQGLEKSLARDVEKGRRAPDEAAAIASRVRFQGGADDLSGFAGCDMVIEAIVEDLDAKQKAFRRVEAEVGPECLLATNTSSLSIAGIASACAEPSRVVGVHFFNPATVLPLVEIIGGITSDPVAVQRARALVDSWGKTTVLASDTPGFIVNRVARPFYGESLRILEERIADVPTIDWAMKELGGFRMGPFELMDLIGNDVNYAVTRSVFEALGHDPRYRPSVTQRRMVEANRLGRKTNVGYYDYRDGAARPAPRTELALGERVVSRVVTMLINEAADAVHFGIASARDVDLAMTRGVSYPKGLLAWADELGAATVHARVEALREEYAEERYRPSVLLRRMAREGGRFFP